MTSELDLVDRRGLVVSGGAGFLVVVADTVHNSEDMMTSYGYYVWLQTTKKH